MSCSWFKVFLCNDDSSCWHHVLGGHMPGLSEHRGTVGICPNHLLAATLTLFQQGFLNFKSLRRACKQNVCTQKNCANCHRVKAKSLCLRE